MVKCSRLSAARHSWGDVGTREVMLVAMMLAHTLEGGGELGWGNWALWMMVGGGLWIE